IAGAIDALAFPCSAIAARMACALSRTAELDVTGLSSRFALRYSPSGRPFGVTGVPSGSSLHRRAQRRLAWQMILEAERYATVDHQLLAGRVARPVGGEESDRFRNILRGAERAYRDCTTA